MTVPEPGRPSAEPAVGSAMPSLDGLHSREPPLWPQDVRIDRYDFTAATFPARFSMTRKYAYLFLLLQVAFVSAIIVPGGIKVISGPIILAVCFFVAASVLIWVLCEVALDAFLLPEIVVDVEYFECRRQRWAWENLKEPCIDHYSPALGITYITVRWEKRFIGAAEFGGVWRALPRAYGVPAEYLVGLMQEAHRRALAEKRMK